MNKLYLLALVLGTLYIATVPSVVKYPEEASTRYWVPGTVVYAQTIDPAPPVVRQAEPKPVAATSISREAVQELVARYGAEFGVRPGAMLDTINCEAQKNGDGTLDPTGQSNFVNKQGKREDSWGLVQIHLPSNPGISKAQAQDPEFAVRFMASEFAAGRASRWTCWRLQH